MGALSDAIQARFGVKTRPVDNPENNVLSTTAELILRQNPDRLAFTVTNLSSIVVFIHSSARVSASLGYRIGVSGGSISFLADEDFDVVGYDWFAIAASGTPTIFVQEQIAE